VATTLPLGQRWVTTYDAVGNVASTTDANGQTVRFEYDARDRLTKKDFPTGTDVTFTYTLTGQRATETDSRGVTVYEYDERDRLTLRTDPDGSAIAYSYDASGNRASVTATVFGNTPRTTSFTFDAVNRLETVSDPELGLTSYSYDAAGNLTQTELPNGIVESREYDERNRLTFLEQAGSSGILASYRYTLTPTGRRAAVEEHDGRRVEYTYDPAGRLTREAIVDALLGDRTFDYTYDAVNNRLSRDDSDAGLTEYTYDANDRLLTETLAGAVTDYTYDNYGNTLSRASATEQVFNTWDFENRLVAADVTDAMRTRRLEYHYNADGIRVAAAVDGAETRYLVDANRALAEVLVEYTPSGLILVSYLRGHDLIAQVRSDGPSIYLADGQGSVRALATAAGLVTDRYIYDAFGVPTSSLGTTPNNYRFLGEPFEPDLGLIYLRARYLNPQLGRFASRDPFPGLWSQPMTLNRFLYAGADPVNHIDPSGLFVITIELSFSFALQNILRGLGGFVGGEIADELGLGIPGRIVGTIAGGWAFGRFGAWVAANPATNVAAAQAAKTTLGQLPAKGSSYAYKGHVTFAPGGVVSSNGKHFNVLLGSVVPPPVFVAIYQHTREHEPSGEEALCSIDGLFREMFDNAGDPYTAEYYLTQLAALRAAGGKPCAPAGPAPDA
jgi:RHS repeat-associated protein